MEVNATSQTAPPSELSANKTGFNALSSDDFLKMMIVQLQNQDPLEPTGNDELLNQISQMRSLQSSIELGDVLKSVTGQQQLTSAASLIGKTVSGTSSGTNGDQVPVSGVADRAFIREGIAYVGVGSKELLLAGVTSIE